MSSREEKEAAKMAEAATPRRVSVNADAVRESQKVEPPSLALNPTVGTSGSSSADAEDLPLEAEISEEISADDSGKAPEEKTSVEESVDDDGKALEEKTSAEESVDNSVKAPEPPTMMGDSSHDSTNPSVLSVSEQRRQSSKIARDEKRNKSNHVLGGSYRSVGAPANLSSSSIIPGVVREREESAVSGPERRRQSKLQEKLNSSTNVKNESTGAFRSSDHGGVEKTVTEEENEEIDVEAAESSEENNDSNNEDEGDALSAELIMPEATPVAERTPVYNAEVVKAPPMELHPPPPPSTTTPTKSPEEIELSRQRNKLIALVIIVAIIVVGVCVVLPSVLLTGNNSSDNNASAAVSPPPDLSGSTTTGLPPNQTQPATQEGNGQDVVVDVPSAAPVSSENAGQDNGAGETEQETDSAGDPTTLKPTIMPVSSPATSAPVTSSTTSVPVTQPPTTATSAPVTQPPTDAVNEDTTAQEPESTPGPTSAPIVTAPEATESPTSSPAEAPIEVPAEAVVQPDPSAEIVLGNLPSDTLDAITNDPESPQALANNWLAGDPSLDSFSEAEQRQRFALATFYYAFNGDDWVPSSRQATDSTSWLSYGMDSCDWSLGGITTNCDNGILRTLEASLISGFNGIMPPEVALLTGLERIQLEGNSMERSVVELIPEAFSQLTSLTEIIYKDNLITGLTPQAAQQMDDRLVAIETLDLSQNTLRGPIPGFDLASINLRHLFLDGNFLDGPLSSEIGRMTRLSSLGLSDNSLTGSAIPMEISLLTELSDLNLHQNLFGGNLPMNIATIKTLRFLDVGDNSMTGRIPQGVGTLTLLQLLDLSQNNFSGDIPELGSLTALTSLMLHDNYLEGFISTRLGLLTDLEVLTLDNNLLEGNIPTELALLANLAILDLGTNPLSGSVPVEFISLTNLQYLNLNGTNLVGEIPAGFCDFPFLETIQVDCSMVNCECSSCECV